MQIAASLMCADPLNMERDIRELERTGVDFWHMDIMDGVYVPNLALNFEVIKAVRSLSSVPVDAHLMVERPEDYVDRCAQAGVNYLSFHLEQVRFPYRLTQRIKDLGMKAGVAINPATGLDSLGFVIDSLDYVLIMTVEPGFAGQTFISATLRKIASVKEMVRARGLNIPIQVDGNINVETAAAALNAGAEILVAGTSSVFRSSGTLGGNLQAFREAVRQKLRAEAEVRQE